MKTEAASKLWWRAYRRGIWKAVTNKGTIVIGLNANGLGYCLTLPDFTQRFYPTLAGAKAVGEAWFGRA